MAFTQTHSLGKLNKHLFWHSHNEMCNYITCDQIFVCSYWDGVGLLFEDAGQEISITFKSPVSRTICHMLTCQLSLSGYGNAKGILWQESEEETHQGDGAKAATLSGISTFHLPLVRPLYQPFSTSSKSLRDFPLFHPQWNLQFSVFRSAFCFTLFFYFLFINCLSCQLCTQLKTTLNYVFCFSQKFRQERQRGKPRAKRKITPNGKMIPALFSPLAAAS